ncbi:MAG: S8 family serine peptidase [Anaerolineae bacterium]
MRSRAILLSIAVAALVLAAVASPLSWVPASSAAPAEPAADLHGGSPGATSGPDLGARTTVSSATDGALDVLGPQLASIVRAGGDELVLVTLRTTANPDLDGVAEYWRATALPLGEGRTVAALVRADRLLKLATHPDVLAVLSDGDNPAPDGNEGMQEPEAREERYEPQLWYSRQTLGADRANANGFDGSGVIVGIEDTGVDFGHPDLHGTFARDPNPLSPYYGFPLAYDNSSAAAYAARGGDPSGTNYADSSAYFTATVGMGQVATASLQLPAVERITDEEGTHSSQTVVTRTVTYRNTSRSGRIHYGVHPDSRLNRTEVISPSTYILGALFIVTDEAVSGSYDTVYADLGTQAPDTGAFGATYDFTASTPARLGPDQDPTVVTDIDNDGLSDLSGGIVYFIADGEHHVPILDWLWDADGSVDPEARIEPPAPGTLVAFYGDFDGNSHGTGVATQIAGQGIINSRYGAGVNIPPGTGITEGDIVVGGVTPGMAPGAKLFGSRALGVPNQWLALTRGYDGVPNTGDDAQVINNSWGSTAIQRNLQYDYDEVATAINAPDQSPRTLIIVSAGNGGQGYSTMGSPAQSSTVLAVGAEVQYGTDDVQEIISDTTQVRTGDPASFSSRGPDSMGRAGVAVMAIGESASGGRPLNLSVSPQGWFNGNNAWTQFGGTSQSAPQTAGVAALVYEAYKSAHGQFPTWSEARALLQFGADDLSMDPAQQGAGRVNADQSTAIAAGLFGASAESGEWTVGDYRGTSYVDFPNVVERGTRYARSVELANDSDRPVTLSVASNQMTEIGTKDIEIPVYVGEQDAYQYKRPDYLVTPDQLQIPQGTDLMQVHMAQDFGTFCLQDPAGPHTGCGTRGNSAWYLRAYAWNDWNQNDRVWDDANGNGVVNDGELDLPVTPTFADEPDPRTSYELAAVAETNLSANTGDLRIIDPLEREANGLHLGLVHRVRSDEVLTDTIRLHVTYYQRQPWPWLEIGEPEITILPGETGSLQASLTVPEDAPLGYHQGAIRVETDPGGDAGAAARVVNALPGMEAVDVYVDGELLASGLELGGVGNYVDFEPGWHHLQVVSGGLGLDSSLFGTNVEVRSGTEYTWAAVSNAVSGTLATYVDGNLVATGDERRVRFANLSPDVGPVDVYANGTKLWSSVPYRGMTGYATLPASGQFTIFATAAGDTDPLATVGPMGLPVVGPTVMLFGELLSGTLNANVADAPERSHFPTHTSSIPVVANVAAVSDLTEPVPFGGMPDTGTLFDLGRVFGLTDWRGNGTARQGDWRSLFVDVPDDSELPPGAMFMWHTTWVTAPTDIDLIAYAPLQRAVAEVDGELSEVVRSEGHVFPIDPAVSGPYDLGRTARTIDTAHGANGSSGTAYSFETVTGGPEEWLVGPLDTGLHLFRHQNVLFAGDTAAGAPFTTEIGSIVVSPPRVHEHTREITDTFTVGVTPYIDLAGLEMAVFGLNPIEVISDTVGQATPPNNRNDVNGNNYYTMTLEASGLIDLDLAPNVEDEDYDLDLFFEVLNEEDGEWSLVTSSAGPTAAEHIEVELPADGTYRAIVNGFEVTEGSSYTLSILDASGTDLVLTGESQVAPAQAGQTVPVEVQYTADFEEGETQYGVLYMGPIGAPTMLKVPVAITRGEIVIQLPLALQAFDLR